MIWKSFGLIFKKKNFPKWNKTHAWVPTPIMISKNEYRVFYAGRDKNNLSDIGSFDINFKNPYKIYNISKNPVLKRGERGYFDDSAAIPSQVIKYNNNFYMYYVGWSQGKTVPFFSSVGLAKSKGQNNKFYKISKSPIICRNKSDNIFIASMFNQTNENKIYYTSGASWKKNKNKFEPNYFIKEAKINKNFDLSEIKDCINNKKNIQAISRPWISKIKNKKYIFYSYRGKNYNIGMAINKNNKWIRKDHKVRFEYTNKTKRFDDKMKEYASVIKSSNDYYMFYNGNDYGKEGIGLAKLISI